MPWFAATRIIGWYVPKFFADAHPEILQDVKNLNALAGAVRPGRTRGAPPAGGALYVVVPYPPGGRSGGSTAIRGLVAALALATPFLLVSEARARDRIPADERYAKLEQVYKNARQNCVLLDKIDETSNRRKSTVKDVIETISLLPEGRTTIERAKAAGVSMCIVGRYCQ